MTDEMADGRTKGIPDLVYNALRLAPIAVHSHLRAALLLTTPWSDSMQLALEDETLSLSNENSFWSMPSLEYRLDEDNDLISAIFLVNTAALVGTIELLQAMCLLLNNQSSVHLYLNYLLVSNLCNTNHIITITTAAGSVVCNQVATCNYTNLWVWMYPVPGNLNIISYFKANYVDIDVGWCKANRYFY